MADILTLDFTIREGNYWAKAHKDLQGNVWILGADNARVLVPSDSFAVALNTKVRTLINSTPT